MQPLKPAENVLPSRKKFIRAIIESGATKAYAIAEYRRLLHQETYCNDLYVASIDRDIKHGFGEHVGAMFEITVRRQDREQHIPFRHAQAIKNQIVGPECEMLELYPAESRLVDTANQYWYYGFINPEVRLPFGMTQRAVTDEADFLNAKQTSTASQ